MAKLESIHLYGFKFGFKCFFFLDIIICSRVKYFFFFIRVRSMLDLSSTFKLLNCYNLQCEFFSHYYMIFCFSNYQNYSLVLFYLNAMFKWAFTFNQCNLSFTWGMRIMANTHTCMNYPIKIWHITKLWSLGFLFLVGSHLPPKFPQLKRKCARLKPAVMARSRWLTERAFVDEPKGQNGPLALSLEIIGSETLFRK